MMNVVLKIRQCPRMTRGSPDAGPDPLISGSFAPDSAATVSCVSTLVCRESREVSTLGGDLFGRGVDVRLNGFRPGSLMGSLKSLIAGIGCGVLGAAASLLTLGTTGSSSVDLRSTLTKQESSIIPRGTKSGSAQTVSLISLIPHPAGPLLVRDSGVNGGASGRSFVSE